MKTVIIGGVAGGASAAARLRRLDESAEIVLLERGEYISFANCGLPYVIGGVIPERDSLLIMTPERFKARFNVDVRIASEAVAIDPAAKCVTVRSEGKTYDETYDHLILSTGSSPLRPPLPGIEDPAVFSLWTIPDLDRILGALSAQPKRAVVVGGGFIGLEAAENLRERGLDVTVVELAPQVLPPFDTEMAGLVEQELRHLGIELKLGRKVAGFEREADGKFLVKLDADESVQADFVLLSIGVRPNSDLAKTAGLTLNERGGIVSDSSMRTSDPSIYAIGDVAEVVDPIGGGRTMIPLAGPANRQGRIVAEVICGRESHYRGSWGAAIVKVGRLTAATVGYSERRLRSLSLSYEKIYLFPASNASYYPGYAPLSMKLIFSPEGKIFGIQIVGAKGVDKRADVLSAAMQSGLTVHDLHQLELTYAPPYSSARDPVNIAGMIADGVCSGDTRIIHADGITESDFLLDVRERAEFENGAIPNAVNIPLGELRNQLDHLPQNRRIMIYCQMGQRGYYGERMLRQLGFDVVNLSGGYLAWRLYHPKPVSSASKGLESKSCFKTNIAPASASVKTVDVRVLQCPGPVVRMKQEIERLKSGESFTLLCNASFRPDLDAWLRATGNLISDETDDGVTLSAVIRKAPSVPFHSLQTMPHSCAIVLFSNDLDKAMAAFIIACGMAASGAKVGIFFTFWGLSVLRKNPVPKVKKGMIEKMFGWMLPKGTQKLSLSKMNMCGLGTMMMKQVMQKKSVTSLSELIVQARELGVRFIACEMAMNVMGLQKEELIEIDEVAGVASFVALAKESNNTLFI